MKHEDFMLKALEQGRKGHPSPNPHVGAVIVKDDTIISVGHHERAGEEHAEIMALRAAGDRARDATLYVTLEPCNHTGKTPPCTEALLAAGIKTVVFGSADPNPHVAGGGMKRLRAAGIEVVTGVCEKACDALIRPWQKFVTQGVPHVSLKLALSLDGRIATKTGSSKWVTGKIARAKVHELRARMDAVAVGIGTALADDPRLTVRTVVGVNPARIVFDTKLRLPLGGRLVATARETPTWVITSDETPATEHEKALVHAGVRIIRVPQSPEGRIDVRAALEALARDNIVSLLVEGGAELAGSFLAGELADDLHAFIAPSLFGPRGRPGAVDWAGPPTPEEAPRLKTPVWELCGEDAYVHGPIDYRR
ncbi:MAG: bifunctional diaminohydroxyphosphoribosylaminopyrimidine deaminase/5-amino-6-(5-phosphoribosylamino)uracil reductase RibD [Polyangiaceae bacterium]